MKRIQFTIAASTIYHVRTEKPTSVSWPSFILHVSCSRPTPVLITEKGCTLLIGSLRAHLEFSVCLALGEAI